MLKKLTRTNEPIRLPLCADTSVIEAQFNAAREEVNKTLDQGGDGEFMGEVMTLVKSAVGASKVLDVMKTVEVSMSALIEKKVRPAQMTKALERLRASMKTHETREALAYVRAQLSIQVYRESSDVDDLLDPSPEGASYVTVIALTPDQRRAAERKAGNKPRKGALLTSRAFDIMRRAEREGEDSTHAYAEHVSSLSNEDQDHVASFEMWNTEVERQIFKAGVVSVDGFDISRGEDGFDVLTFIDQCAEAEEVISETSRHVRNISTLGKSVNSSPSLESGTDAQEAGGQPSQTGGNALSVSTVEEDHPSAESLKSAEGA